MASVAHDAHLPALEHHGREETGRELQATLVELVDLSLIGKQLPWNISAVQAAARAPPRARRLVARSGGHRR